MFAILKREFRSYFQNIIGWLFVAAVLAVFGLYFFAYNLSGGYPYVSYDLSAISFIMLIAVPILAMRSFSEDRKNKVDQLVLTAPVSVGKIVLGKYFAMVGVFSIDMLIICMAPLVLSFFGTIPMGESYVAILGFWLYGAAFIAIGMFISSITESQVIAAVLSFAVFFLGYMMGSIETLVSADGNLLTQIMGAFDLYAPFEKFLSGTLDLTSVTYYISVIALFVFLTGQSIQKRRWSMSSKRIATGVFSTGFIVAAIALTLVVNMVVSALPASITAIDCSYGKLYVLTDDTKEFLEGLDEDITIYVLVSEANKDAQIDETLRRYEDLSKYLTVEYVNPSTSPTFYQGYTDSSPTTNSLIVVSEERSRVLDYSELYVYDYSMDYTTYSYSTQLTGYDAEGQITSAIEYCTMDSEELPVIYEITGHGETALSGSFTDALTKANVTLESIELMTEEQIPEDAQAIIINGPTSDFNAADAQKVLDYLQAGGKAIIAGNYAYQDLTNFNSILSAYDVSFAEGLIGENDGNYYYNSNPFYLLPVVNSSVYTQSVTSSYIFAPAAEGIIYPDETDTADDIDTTDDTDTDTTDTSEDTDMTDTTDTTGDDTTDDTDASDDTDTADDADTSDESTDDTETAGEITYTALLSTTDAAVSKATTGEITTTEYEEGDIQGPFDVAVAVEQTIDEENTSQIVVLGSYLFLSDEADQIVSGNNSEMFTDIISNMVGDTELASSVIPVKSYTLSNITVATMSAIVLGIAVTIAVPILLIMLGIVIWAIRRKK